MPRRVVRPGDCAASLAARAGVGLDELWNHPDNASLRARRGDPYQLCAGDEIEVPEARVSPSSLRTGGTNAFVGPEPVPFKLRVLDVPISQEHVERSYEDDELGVRIREPDQPVAAAGSPLANAAFRLVVGGRTIEGTTDGDGVIEAALDAVATHGVLFLFPDSPDQRKLELRLGYLDPADEPSGLGQRLSNLGFPHADEAVAKAIARYQQSRGLEVTGELDESTKARLIEESGG